MENYSSTQQHTPIHLLYLFLLIQVNEKSSIVWLVSIILIWKVFKGTLCIIFTCAPPQSSKMAIILTPQHCIYSVCLARVVTPPIPPPSLSERALVLYEHSHTAHELALDTVWGIHMGNKNKFSNNHWCVAHGLAAVHVFAVSLSAVLLVFLL